MAIHAYRLQTVLLVCLTAAWPLAASGQASATPASAERLAVSQTAPEDADDPIWLWFRKQDKLLDEILMRLARIERLVGDIHRLVEQMPDRFVPVAAPVPPASSAQPPSPVASAPGSSATVSRFIADWGPQLAGGGLLGLLLLWRARRRGTAAASKKAAPPVAKVSTPAPAKRAAVPAARATVSAPAMPAVRAATAPAPAPAPPQAEAVLAEDFSEQADQSLELAEIMLSMGLGHGAAQTLTEQIRTKPKQALRHWLKLLEIYRANGQQDEFEHSAEELRKYFNVNPKDWHAESGAPHSLEYYPHIATRLTELWGNPACLVYLQNLLADNRGGSRAGFPQAVAEELLLLSAMLRNDATPAS